MLIHFLQWHGQADRIAQAAISVGDGRPPAIALDQSAAYAISQALRASIPLRSGSPVSELVQLERRVTSLETQPVHQHRNADDECSTRQHDEYGPYDGDYMQDDDMSYQQPMGQAEPTSGDNVSAMAIGMQPVKAVDSHVPFSSPQDLLHRSIALECCEIWFQKYHRWFPILHQPSFMAANENLGDRSVGDVHGPVVQAIVAVVLMHLDRPGLDTDRKEALLLWLSNDVVMHALENATLAAIQALLVLSILHYGRAEMRRASNVLALCRSTANGMAATSPTALRRLPQFVNTVVAHEEKIRAYWMIEMLDSMSAIGARYTIPIALTPGNPLLPCSDSMWAFPESLLDETHIRPYHYCSAFSLNVVLATTELSRVHAFLLKPVAMEIFEERDAWQSEAQTIDERLTVWRDEFVAAVYRLINAEYANHDRPEMDPYIVLTNCVLNAAVITLLQQRASCPEGVIRTVEPWAFANNRCVYASENTAFKVRQMEEDELLVCHPHLVFSIFVAARFYLVHSKASDANVPSNLHSLAFALHTCGKRWRLARAFERIIRIAVAEYRTPIATSTVPREFFDLKLTTLHISSDLVKWVEEVSPDVPIADGVFSALT
ncbi:hypothetical protein LTR86_009314 [Recurvomyces mirabilis]|nr:hypothetical protein LTR86_009314 [Recurvomyces mirabilis]